MFIYLLTYLCRPAGSGVGFVRTIRPSVCLFYVLYVY